MGLFFRPGGDWLLRRRGFWSDKQDLPLALTKGRIKPSAPLATFPEDVWAAPAFAPDGDIFGPVYHLHYQLILCDMSGKRRRTLTYPERSAIDQAAFSPDGRLLATGGQDDFRALLWDLTTGKEAGRLPLPWGLSRMIFSPDSRLLALGTGPVLRLWDVTTGQVRMDFRGFKRIVRSAVFSPDGRLLAAGSDDSRVVVWEVESAHQVAEYDWNVGAINDLAFAPDGATAAAAGAKKTIVVWDVD
jgi:WD40 repeat protein